MDRNILARLDRRTGSRSDVTHSLEGIEVTEAGRPRGWLSSHRRQRARSCARSLSPLPPLFNHLTFFFLHVGSSHNNVRLSWGELEQPRASSHYLASLPEVQRYLAWNPSVVPWETCLPFFFSILLAVSVLLFTMSVKVKTKIILFFRRIF